MRLHRLLATAFGPFADTVEVDFDGLSEGGLFLLAGPTGAGKSSVLDAVCFALYGDVPGDRSTVKRLRCDQAAPDVAPTVVLEATLSGRRFRIERSPAWERPKKRGTGTTVQQASVCLSEREDGEWRAVSTRLDETGHLVARLVGMSLGQFCQVALLPQGRFQAFLRARSEDRHALLQRVFRTDRFDRVEKWLRDHRIALRRASEDHEQAMAVLVNRVSEASGSPVPEVWDEIGLASAADEGALAAWCGELHDTAGRAAGTAAVRATSAEQGERRARSQLDEGRRTADLQARHATASQALVRLDTDDPAHRARCDEVDAARRAGALSPVLSAVERASRAAEECQRTTTARLAGAEIELPDTDDVDAARAAVEAARRAAVGLSGRVRAALPREDELAEVEQGLIAARQRVHELTARLEELDVRVAALPADLGHARTQVTAARRAADAVEAVTGRVATLRERLAAHRQLVELLPRLETARAHHFARRAHLQAAREHWLAVREARLEGMAAEIAGRLAVGGCCPVCGSADHPSPAVASRGAPDATAEKAARRDVDDADIAAQATDEQVRALETSVALARQQSGGGSLDEVRDELARAEADLSARHGLASGLVGHESRLSSLQDEQRSVEARRARTASELESTSQVLTALTARRDGLAAELAGLLDRSGADSLAALDRLLTRQVEAHDVAMAALERQLRALASAAEARRTASAAAADAGFADVDAARAAMRSAEQVEQLAALVREHEQARARAEQELLDPDVAAAATRPAPDLDALGEAVHTAALATAEAREEASLLAGRTERLGRLRSELDTALAAWAPVRQGHVVATRVAAMVDGTSPDNELRMRLSAYVLAHRLAQVVDAANLRLSTMSDRRYSLEHSGRRGAGETRGGLSLLVRDDWSGERRDPATLSGGETFVVSLALALGLADVITQEAGGADLDTLFVDEGFGSLDADTLDDVMDTLDALRDGGRVVGVVSHVAEMRDRIPTQLLVDKQRTGSTLRTRLG